MEKIKCNFSYMSYICKYSATQNDKKKSKKLVNEINKDDTEEVCFSKIFRMLTCGQGVSPLKDSEDKLITDCNGNKIYKLNYNVLLFTDPDAALATVRNNCCIFTIEECEQWMSVLKRIMDINFSFVEGVKTLRREQKAKCYIANLDVTGNIITHKFALTWLRYLYEWPYVGAVADVMRLKNCDGFKMMNYINLMSLVIGSIHGMFGSGHSIFESSYLDNPTEKLTFAEIKRRMCKVDRLNDIYKTNYESEDNDSWKPCSSFKGYETNEWLDDENFKKRLKVYRNNKVLMIQG